jgi:phosphatidylglycerol---prolipoprotein diacylglyceryl transferase
MRPTAFTVHLGGHALGLHTYGLLVALGFAVGIVLFWREGRRQGLNGGRLLDLSFWCIVAGLVGSRLAFVAVNADEFADACFGRGAPADGRIVGCSAILRFWEGGFVFYGGLLGAGLVVAWFCRREGWSFWRLGDLAAPTLAIGHALGRLGCFAAGCCFGKACGAPWAVSFPAGSVAHQELTAVGVVPARAETTTPLHPTQLYEAFGELVIFVVLLLLRRRWNRSAAARDQTARGSRAPGALILLYAGSYALLRFCVEIFRGDSARRYVFEWAAPALARGLGLPPEAPLLLSVSQLVSLLVLVAVGVAMNARARAPRLPRSSAFTAPSS